jgi:hypothetical protein
MTIGKYVQAALITGLALFLMAGSAQAAPLCLSSTTMDALISLGIGGCSSGNVTFSNFSYTRAGTDPVATSVTAGLVNLPLTDGWNFTPSNSGVWASGFTLSYTVTSLGAPWALVTSSDQMFTGQTPNGAASSDIQTGVGTLSLSGTSTAVETVQSANYSVTSITTTTTLTAGSGNGWVSSYNQHFTETNVPEPATLSLIGGALLGLGVMLRRKKA